MRIICGTCRRKEKCDEPEGKNHWEGIGTDGRIIRNWIL
jgi:hypothetical protein